MFPIIPRSKVGDDLGTPMPPNEPATAQLLSAERGGWRAPARMFHGRAANGSPRRQWLLQGWGRTRTARAGRYRRRQHSAGPVLRVGLTEAFVTGMRKRWISVRQSPMGMPAKPTAAPFEVALTVAIVARLLLGAVIDPIFYGGLIAMACAAIWATWTLTQR